MVLEETKGFTNFSSDYVKMHTLSFAPTYTLQEVSLIPSVSLQLPPLEQTLTPKLAIEYKDISSSFSLGVKENDSEEFDIFNGNFFFAYKGKNVKFTNSVNYVKSDLITSFVFSSAFQTLIFIPINSW